jgi:hypothetical protein
MGQKPDSPTPHQFPVAELIPIVVFEYQRPTSMARASLQAQERSLKRLPACLDAAKVARVYKSAEFKNGGVP